jgi:hypothetical protein
MPLLLLGQGCPGGAARPWPRPGAAWQLTGRSAPPRRCGGLPQGAQLPAGDRGRRAAKRGGRQRRGRRGARPCTLPRAPASGLQRCAGGAPGLRAQPRACLCRRRC